MNEKNKNPVESVERIFLRMEQEEVFWEKRLEYIRQTDHSEDIEE